MANCKRRHFPAAAERNGLARRTVLALHFVDHVLVAWRARLRGRKRSPTFAPKQGNVAPPGEIQYRMQRKLESKARHFLKPCRYCSRQIGDQIITLPKAALHCIVGLFALLSSLSSPTTWAQSGQENSHQENENKPQNIRFQPPYPFLQDELLSKLRRVLTLPEGHITRDKAEAAFGIKIPEDERAISGPRQPGIHYLAMKGVDWYFPVSVIDGSSTKSSSTFSLEIGGMGLRYPNVCISEKMTSDALSQGGWIFKEAPPTPQWGIGPFKIYTKGALGKAILLFATNGQAACLNSILVITEYQRSSK